MGEGIWSRELTLRTKDVDMHRRMRTSRLLELLQEASIAHTEELGWPRSTTLDRGFLWMIAMQRIEIARMPEYDEAITLSSWPGPMMHVLFPRQYLVEDAQGNVLIRGSALWTLVDRETRAMADPDVHGVVIPGMSTERDLPLPGIVRPEECDRKAGIEVPFSYCDLNGHMNNTRYLDVVEDHLAGPAEGRELASVAVQYSAEVRYGDEVLLRWHEDGDGAFAEGSKDGRDCFRVRLGYR